MLMWHSSIYHSVHSNLSEDTRISISFNIALAWSDHYLSDE
jgi:ectoine hydroxylase-related dioxygenase (phytanoyl-CoA dioxygenase family)